MKKLLFVMLGLVMSLGIMAEDQFVNLTPRPKQITVGTGVYTLPQAITVGTGQLADSLVAEADKFAEVLRVATGRNVTVSATTKANIVLRMNADIKNVEGYKVTVTTDGVTAEASTAAGLFYALQTIKKIMPLNVMAGVYDHEVKEFTLPVCTIDDEPRFEYRGFMLDVSRHFFDVEQVKRMLDVMAYYKLNKFHWHLTDDQGWRIEIKKYPKLCTIGATRDFSFEVDPVFGRYQTYEPYGPFFYTQEQAKEVVEYAKKLHIEVIPEVDMPGHFVAAMTAYPEFSCTPNGRHNVWVDGGISTDVLNVANPKAVQFTKDIITELAEIFPSKHIHIGGDECPTTAWENNAECQAMYKELKLKSYRALQSQFIKQIDEHVKSLGKHLFMWNESISANGADQDIVQKTDATIMCWTSPYAAAETATKRGLKCIITPWGPYYINRVQSTDPGEPVGAGNGADTAERTYKEVPVPANVPDNLKPLYIGVQGTFWCEHVGTRYLLEYLALPRLICVAEAGWTPQDKKDWNDFKRRWNEDYKMLDYNGYYYGKHFIEKKNDDQSSNSKVMPTEGAYYRIVTTATDAARANACIEVLPEGSSKIGTGNAQAYRLWQMPQVSDESNSEYDYQWFTFELDPSGSGFYAMVCKALPNGSVNPTPTASNNTARFDYDRNTKHYAWQIGTHTYGQLANGHYKYTLHSTKQSDNMYMNAAAGGQQYSINQWSDPNDGNGGIWEFVPAVEPEIPDVSAHWPAEGDIVRFENAVKHGILLYADESTYMKNGTDRLTANAWQVVKTNEPKGASMVIQLKNVFTGKCVNALGLPVSMGKTACNLTLTWNTDSLVWNLNNMAPILSTYGSNPGCVTTTSKSNESTTIKPIYPQGAAWHMVHVQPIIIRCKDTDGNIIATYNSSLSEGEDIPSMLPTIKNFTFDHFYAEESTDDAYQYYTAVYKRVAYSVSMRGINSRGIILCDNELNVNVGDHFTVAWPDMEFYKFESSDADNGSVITPTEDMALTATYDTGDALFGFQSLIGPANAVEKKTAYVIYNAHPSDASRNGYLHTTANNALWLENNITCGDPAYVWTASAYGSSSLKFNNECNLYIPTLAHGSMLTAVSERSKAGTFRVTDNKNGTFNVKNDSGSSYYWNGNAGGCFTGWDEAHPYAFYSFVGKPYFYVTINMVEVDASGSETNHVTKSTLVPGGSDQTALLDEFTPREDYDLIIDNADALKHVPGTTVVNVIYSHKANAIHSIKADDNDKAYDLSGRPTTSKRGIIIKHNQKVVL